MLVSFPKPPENCNAMIKLSINVLNNLKRISDVVLPIHSYEGKNTLNAWSSLETGPFCSHTVVLSCNTTLFPILSLFHIIYIYTHIYIYIYIYTYIYIPLLCMKEKGRVEFGIRFCLLNTRYGFSFSPI